MRKILFYILLLIYLFTFSQEKYSDGYPLVHFYSTENVAERQNWAIEKDDNNIIYFGNNLGVVEYNGEEWRLIKLKNSSIVRSLYKSSSGRIYVGGNNNFGYLSNKNNGNTKFICLSDSIDKLYDYGDIWDIIEYKSSIFFFTQGGIFEFKDNKIDYLGFNRGQFSSFKLHNNLYVSYGTLILKKTEKGFKKIKDLDLALVKSISKDTAIVVIENNELAYLTYKNDTDFYLIKTNKYIDKNKNVKTFDIDINKKGDVVIATFSGLYIFNKNLNCIYNFTNKNILNNNSILSVKYDEKGNLWVCSNSDISYIELSSNISIFNSLNNVNESNLYITEFKNRLYLGSMPAIKYLTKNSITFKDIKGADINNFGRYIYKTKNDSILLLTSYNKLFMVKDSIPKIIYTDENAIILSVNSFKNINKNIVIGTITGAKILFLDDNNNVIGIKKIKDVYGMSKGMEADNQNNIWESTYFNGIYLLRYDSILNKIKVQHFDTSKGIPSNNENYVFYSKLINRIFVVNKKGIYIYTEKNGKAFFEKDSLYLGKFISDNGFKPSSIIEYENNFIINTKRRIIKAEYLNNKLFWDTISFSKIQANSTGERNFVDSEGNIWFICTDEIIKYKKKHTKLSNNRLFTLIYYIGINNDSVLYDGAGENAIVNKNFVFDYKHNSFTIKFTLPEYDGDKLYKYKLEGYDSKWHEYSSDNKAVYTNLNAGEYTFKVIGQSAGSLVGKQAVFKFKILPPWYKTTYFYILVTILAILFIYLIVKLTIYQQKRQRLKLEQLINERTYELSKKNKTITDSINYAKRIQKAILPGENFLKNYFNQIFVFYKPRDIVSGDFYWFYQTKNYKYLVVGDCTGHGVPGALMSMIGNTILNQAVVDAGNEPLPSELLETLSKEIVKLFKNKDSDFADGMDVSVVRISKDNQQIILALANTQAIFIDKENKTHIVSGDLYSIGGFFNKPTGKKFTDIPLENIEFLYLFTDGYTDQFGGENEQKFGIKRLETLLHEIHELSAEEQKHIVMQKIIEWKHNEKQIDDILIIGVKP